MVQVAQQAKSAEEFQLGRIPGATYAFSLTTTQDSERLLLDLCRKSVNLLEEPDAANLQVRFCEGSSTTDVWLRWCGTAGKPGGNGEHKHQPTASGEADLLDFPPL